VPTAPSKDFSKPPCGIFPKRIRARKTIEIQSVSAVFSSSLLSPAQFFTASSGVREIQSVKHRLTRCGLATETRNIADT
jgi:hypothetical protein